METKRNTRSKGKRAPKYNNSLCEKCKEIEDIELERTLIQSKYQEEDVEELQELDKKLKYLKGHICNNHYVNLEEIDDDDYLLDSFLNAKTTVQTRSSTKRSLTDNKNCGSSHKSKRSLMKVKF